MTESVPFENGFTDSAFYAVNIGAKIEYILLNYAVTLV